MDLSLEVSKIGNCKYYLQNDVLDFQRVCFLPSSELQPIRKERKSKPRITEKGKKNSSNAGQTRATWDAKQILNIRYPIFNAIHLEFGESREEKLHVLVIPEWLGKYAAQRPFSIQGCTVAVNHTRMKNV